MLAIGLGVTMPAIMILGFDLEATRTILVAAALDPGQARHHAVFLGAEKRLPLAIR